MASLFEYFLKDLSRDLSIERKWKLQNTRDGSDVEVHARVYLDFYANAKYAAFYVPLFDGATFPEALLMNSLNDILQVSTILLVPLKAGVLRLRRSATAMRTIMTTSSSISAIFRRYLGALSWSLSPSLL